MFWSRVTSSRRKIDRGAQADAGGAGDPFDGAGAGPHSRQERHRREPDEHDHGQNRGLRRAVRQQARDERDHQDDDGLEQSELDRAAHDRRNLGEVVVSAQFHRRVHAVSMRGESAEVYAPGEGPAKGRQPHASTTITSVTAHAPSAWYIRR